MDAIRAIEEGTADKDIELEDTEEFTSFVEKQIAIITPKVISSNGRKAVLVIWTIATIISIYAALNVRTDFSMELFIPEGSNTEKYIALQNLYYKTGFMTRLYVESEEYDYSLPETQY